jgi:hypothetical protein
MQARNSCCRASTAFGRASRNSCRKGDSGAVNFIIEVDSFEEILKRLEGYPILMPERTTSYGMREIGVRDPAGNGVIFAARIPQ